MKSLLLLVFFTFLFKGVYGKAVRVPQDQPTIQAGIDASSDGDTVLVSPGTYYENVIFRGKNIVLTSNYIFSNDPLDIETTVINGSQPANPDSASCVRMISGETRQAQLIGFTITGGKGTAWPDEHSSGTFREGGGILIALSSPTIKYNRIIYNQASDNAGFASAGGGGIRAGDGNSLIEGNFIAYNTGRYGGGLVLNFTGAVVRNNIFYRNSGGEDYGGGAVWINGTNPNPRTLTNNTIIENSSVKGGGGIYVWSTTVITANNIVYGNTGGTKPNIRVITGASLSAEYSLVQGGYSGTGNIDADPLLESDFTLTAGSPCIDAGNPNTLYNDIADPDNPVNAKAPSMGTLRNDIGAYGGPFAHYIPQIPVPVEDESGQAPDNYRLLQNYPNPFNPSTKINFSLPRSERVSLKVYDLLGREVIRLVEGELQSGLHEIEFNGEGLSSGIYLYKLRAGEFTMTKKMQLIK